MAWVFEGGQVLREAALAEESLALDGALIADKPVAGAKRFDARGLLVLPGLVDLHGDAHERQLQPRPGVEFPADIALRDSASQLVANGITTAFLATTLSWEPGLRSIQAWRNLLAAMEREAPDAACDLRIHCRFEADNLDALDEVLGEIADGRVHLLAFNDHTPEIAKKLVDPDKAAKYAGRAGVSIAEFRALAERALERRPEVPAARRKLAEAASAAGLPMASHDDETPEERGFFRDLGARICEFPMAESVAEHARAAGEAVVMGSPNVLRGGSHLGWASAAPLAERGLVTVLASDYYWPAMLQAAFVLAGRGVLSLPQAWALVSTNPAMAAGLQDRGRLAPGLRGDVVLVAPPGPGVERPRLVACFAAGRPAFLAADAAARLI